MLGSGVLEKGLAETIGAPGEYDECSYEDSTQVLTIAAIENTLTIKGKVKLLTFQCTVDEDVNPISIQLMYTISW